MNQPKDLGATQNEAEALVSRVQRMRLRGAVALFIIEGGGVEEAPGDERGVARKLGILARQTDARVVACRTNAGQRDALACEIPAERLEFADTTGPLDVTAHIQQTGVAADACLTIFSTPGARIPEGCHTFYVGAGDPSNHAVATRLPGVEGANTVLALYGTALAQVRAGYAFRATSAGNRIPDTQDLPAGIWDGVCRSVERPTATQPAAQKPLPDGQQLRDLARHAVARLLPNLQPNGAVVGSPARGQKPGEPNYWFFWQRDGAATMTRLVALQYHPARDIDTRDLAQPITRYLDFLAAIQANGPLGTSRYQVTGEPVLGFGNPQLDGPALTVLALARLGDPARTWPIVKPYLDFLLAPAGQGRTMDAWEFVYGRTFNATLLRRKVMLLGARLALYVGQTGDATRYREAAQVALAELDAFEDRATGRLVASRDTLDPWFGAISGLDMDIISAVLAGEPIAGSEPLGTALDQLTHPAVLATMAALEDVFAPLYRVNGDWCAGGNSGWGLGRFPEDANDGLGSSGGNPWPLTTLWGAQFYHRLARELGPAVLAAPHGLVLHDARQAAFINRAAGMEAVAVDRPLTSDVWHEHVLPALRARSAGYLNFVVHHLPSDAGTTEQIDRDTGQPHGAPNLSWALAELIATIAMRPAT